VDRVPAGPVAGPAPAVAEPRQRWRIAFARPARALDTVHRDIADRWIAGLQAQGLPLPRGEGRPKAPLSFAAPLPLGVVADCELADLVLAERLPAWRVREAVARAIPAELDLLDVHDVWLGSRPLAALVRAADYRTVLDPAVEAADLDRTEHAVDQLMAATTLERERPRAAGTVRYDLRPLLERVRLDRGPDPALRIRTRFLPDRGAGRPEEVVAALEALAGCSIPTSGTTRQRLILAES
jgi:radical SAM-linked protein